MYTVRMIYCNFLRVPQNKAISFVLFVVIIYSNACKLVKCLQQCIYYYSELLSSLRESDYYPRNILVLLTDVLLYFYHRYLPARLELFRWLLLLRKSGMRLVADRWIKLLYGEFQFGNGSQSRRKCLHSTPSQRREILDWTQWPKCGGLLCVDKQRNKQI